MKEADASAEIIAALVRGADGKPSTDLSGFFLCASPRSATAHVRWSEDVFREGSQIKLEFGGVRHGYTAALMRTFSIGKPSDRLRQVHQGEMAGLEAALAAGKPASSCGDGRRGIQYCDEDAFLRKESRCGYSIGID